MMKPLHDQSWSSFTEGPLQLVTTPIDHPNYYVKRLDLVDSWASGNKYYKLKYVMKEALDQGVTSIVSKGGMFSNHLAALSSACVVFNLRLIAVIRSHKPDEANPSIKRLRAMGAEIMYVSGVEYNSFDTSKAAKLFPEAMFIPEGGLSELGIMGSAEIVSEIASIKPSHVLLAGGTMSTACGIMSALPASARLIIVPAWKGCTNQYLEQIIAKYNIQYRCSWEFWPTYHFGGFGKFNQQLIDFVKSYGQAAGIPLDPVYTAKLMFAIHDKMSTGYFDPSDSIVAIHSGGMQGLEGYAYRFSERWKNL